MSLSDFIFDFFSTGIPYLILAAQVHAGFPPFYRRRSWGSYLDADDSTITSVLPILFAMAVAIILFALTEFRGFLIALGIIGFWGGFHCRQDLAKNTDGPLHWVTNPWPSHPFYTLAWTVKWPMLVFDVWTIGFSMGIGLLMILPGLD